MLVNLEFKHNLEGNFLEYVACDLTALFNGSTDLVNRMGIGTAQGDHQSRLHLDN